MRLYPAGGTAGLHPAVRAAHRQWLRRRDFAADELFEKLAELRLTFHLQFGAGSSEELLGIEDDVPIEPSTLFLVARNVYDSLVDRHLELPVQRLADLFVQPSRWAAGLERPLRDLTAALDALDRLLPSRESPLGPERRSR
jgi:hypothetical protein